LKHSILSAFPFYTVILIWGFGSGLLTPILPLFIRSLGFSIEEWGYLVTVYAMSTFLFEWLWGALADRVDRRAFIFFGLISGSVLMYLYTLRELTPLLYLLQFIRGALFIMVGPAVKAMVSDVNSGGIGLSMSLYSSTRRLGSVVGPFVGSVIAETLSYGATFHVYAIIYILGALITLTIPKIERLKRDERKESSIVEDCKVLFSQRAILTLFLVSVIVYMGITVITSYMPIYAKEVIGISTVNVGVLFSFVNIAGFLTTPIFGWLSDNHGRMPVIISCFILSTITLCTLFLVVTSLQLILVFMAFTICFSPLTPMLLATLVEVTPKGILGTSMGLYSTFENLGIVLTPLVYSLIWSTHAPNAIFIVGAITQLFGLLLLIAAHKKFRT
jgi:DHA1 family multidrug resistance protein-like MFS transporter